jgi:osomolarity two-component system response regulator SSK1
MPVMDGIQATKEIRRLEKTNASAGYPPTTPSLDDQRTPPVRTPSDASTESRSTSSPYRSSVIIVALTASSLQSDRVAALAAGCNDFLTKPVSLLWLNSKIIEWGSIKALQMWADLRPDVAKTISTGQAAQARNVAERLHVPKGRSTPSPSHPSTLSGGTRSMENVSSAMLVPPMTGVPPDSAVPMSTTSSAFWSPAQPSPLSFWGGLGIPSPAVNHRSRSNYTQVSPIVNTDYPSSQPWHPPSTDAPRGQSSC